MHISKHSPQAVSAIVPAYNEQNTILNVIHLLEKHPLISEVIVVSDGSTDDTARIARTTSATVIELQENVGKGDAMTAGVEYATHDIILFADADLLGLTEQMISQLVEKVTSGRYDMFTLVRDRTGEYFQLYLPPQYVVGGERVLRRDLWNMVPAKERNGFGIELALNYYALKKNKVMGYMLAPGLKQVIKEKKMGLIPGFYMRLWEIAQCLKILFKLHLFRWESKPAYS